jgi:starch synthase (maltosyl-transferring)
VSPAWDAGSGRATPKLTTDDAAATGRGTARGRRAATSTEQRATDPDRDLINPGPAGPLRRVVIEHVRPALPDGLAAKATVGLAAEVSADVLADGHDMLRAWAVFHRDGGAGNGAGAGSAEIDLAPLGNDRWAGRFTPTHPGRWWYEVFGIIDRYGTWLRDLELRLDAGQDVELELEEGALMVDRALLREDLTAADREALSALQEALRTDGAPTERVRRAGAAKAVAAMRHAADLGSATGSGRIPLWVDRELGGFSAWYEMFPRSEGASAPPGDGHSGTFATAARRLPAIAEMGFDIVYLPPIHPIGRTFRKGPNNTTEAAPESPGSPWAIGAEEGGHTAVHPDLGTLKDFDAFVAAARRSGLEVALDYALQCSPDHPWVKEHPDWFRHRPDGSIRYAENPPKRYQDIYPIDFETADRAGLHAALRDVLLFWMEHGVRVFRVDNPHTKPFEFWRWVIEEVHRRDPGVVFLSEAFTRPRVMERLAKVGFTQSYTYFTWRNTKAEITQYLQELSQTELVDWFRPNFWVNTPDILHEVLQLGGPAAFRLRLLLAAITCPNWGMYSGYELCENIPVRPGSEEYMDSEKYQYRPRDWSRKDSLAPLVAQVNRIRREHREAIAQLRNLRLHHVDSNEILCVSRASDDREDVILLLVNLDPHNVREGITGLDLDALGIDGSRPFIAHDELSGDTYTWRGPANYVRLDPRRQPGHVLRLSQPV